MSGVQERLILEKLRSFPEKRVREVLRFIMSLERLGKHDRRPPLTAKALLDSGLIGLWQDRKDIPDSPTFARQLREQAQRREGGK